MAFTPLDRDPIPQPCITLVGMAAAGKSTLGQKLAERLGWGQLDTDRHMEAFYAMPLQGIMDTFGLDEFLRIEETLVSDLGLTRTVISTGGSVIYGPKAVARLKELGKIVMLDIDRDTFLERVGDGENRGLAIAPGKSMSDLYNERQPLYRAAADIVVRTDRHTPEECVDQILEAINLP
ncbi:Shikimate kinase [Pseudodesulfovibrio profundus]|uniref:Shikimate kinase n=1 Tax=Pseudodesulfovibrio profundus TaxID=57320 RepID=A0A2C8FA82_9BACT|nr:homoserine kinase [Pseudodesulfovibrio profundus]MBC15835.1 shikimate kinase [Desulfovibrio sp.]SOB59555.1 Shikimate kinase [Pseudodesulfovibrio profundus]|tara:strand:+ start:6188 stop:6724 length:537 start_codon:yes stop_codon:yes gene_type:complete